MEEQKNNFKKLTFFIVIFLVIITLISFFFLLNNKDKKKMSDQSNISSTQLFDEYSEVKAKTEGELIFKKIDDLNYLLVASSNNKAITGFDLLIELENSTDQESVDFSSILPSFSLYKVTKNNFLIITGVKNLNFDQEVVFEQTPIVDFKIKKPLKLTLKENWEKYNTKFVDSENNVLNPKISLK